MAKVARSSARIAGRLRAEAPDAFELLATVPIPFEALVSEEDQWRAQGRVISVAADGDIGRGYTRPPRASWRTARDVGYSGP